MKRLGSIMQAANREKKTEQESHQHRLPRPDLRFAQETTAKQTREGTRAQKTPTQEPPDTGGSPSVS